MKLQKREESPIQGNYKKPHQLDIREEKLLCWNIREYLHLTKSIEEWFYPWRPLVFFLKNLSKNYSNASFLLSSYTLASSFHQLGAILLLFFFNMISVLLFFAWCNILYLIFKIFMISFHNIRVWLIKNFLILRLQGESSCFVCHILKSTMR